MIMQFVIIYVTAFLVLVLMEDDHDDNIFALVFIAILEIIVAGIVNAIWVKQSFWSGVLLPIVLISLSLPILLNLLDNRKIPALSAIYDYGSPWREILKYKQLKNLEKTIKLIFSTIIAAIVFALCVFDYHALTSITSKNASTILNINSYIFFWGGLLLLLNSVIGGWITNCFMIFHKYGKSCTCQRCGKVSHKWDGCKCRKCGEVRNENHDWDGCKCRKCGEVRNENHDWDGCKCRKCEKTRNENHDWDGCECRKCGEVRNENHDWDGCECRKCEKTRNEGHDWNGCKCWKCGKTRNEGHDWDSCKCQICGSTRDEHMWDGCKCKKCEETRHNWGGWEYHRTPSSFYMGDRASTESSGWSSRECLNCGASEVEDY
jgi:hypothetical protein